jgi:alpha-tubulin suppressor-like RCC1 family protein
VSGFRFDAVNVGLQGSGHTCAVTPEHAAYCWGWNFAGQLGDGTTTTRLSPVAVAGQS